MTSFVARCKLAAPREALYAWHARPGTFERLTPPRDGVRLAEDSGGIGDGARKVLVIGPLGIRWVAVHDSHVAGRQFRDVQQRGPFRRWEHTHTFLDDVLAGPGHSILEDSVEYELPLGVIGEIAAGWAVRRKLVAMFAHRHRVTRHDVELAAHEPAGELRLRLESAGRGERRVEESRVDALWAFLSAIGWHAERATSGATSAPLDSLNDALNDALGHALLHVRSDSVAIECRAHRVIVPLPDAADASLVGVHRALRRFEADAP